MTINGWVIAKETVRYIYIYMIIYYSVIKKEGNSAICDNMPWECYAKWSKSGREWQMLYDIMYMWTVNTKLIDTEDMCLHAKSFSCVQLSATPWTVAHQAPLSMGFSKQEYWSGLPCPLPADLHYPGIEPASHISPALAGRSFTTSTTWEAPIQRTGIKPGSSALQLDSLPAELPGKPIQRTDWWFSEVEGRGWAKWMQTVRRYKLSITRKISLGI